MIPILFLSLACSSYHHEKEELVEEPDDEQAADYTGPYRPQVHFSPPSQWMNDPNGMVYFAGEYHLFYQHYPDSAVWGPMHWGHAISKDLVTWENYPIALSPDSLGYIFSGSVVVDQRNTSGLGTLENPPMVALFTYHDQVKVLAGMDSFQSQGLAYSLDKGRTWTKYNLNPILLNPGTRDFRDPKVFWHSDSGRWIMVLAEGDHIGLYGSENLREWQKLSEFGKNEGSHEGVWECPDLFELKTTSGQTKKWVLLVSIGPGGERGSATQYFVGDFDGTKFTNSRYPEARLWLDHGRDNYAGVTWSNIPKADGRTIFLGWMNNWQYAQVVPSTGWRGMMTLPRTLELLDTNTGYQVVSYPIKEVELLRKRAIEIKRRMVVGEADWSSYLDPSQPFLDMELIITKVSGSHTWSIKLSNSLGEYTKVGYNYQTKDFYIDRENSGQVDFSKGFAGIHYGPRRRRHDQMAIRLIIDRSSIELFGDKGEVAMTDLFFPNRPYDKLTISSGEEAVLFEGVVYQLNSIWEDEMVKGIDEDRQ